jgi:hypothetical protein
LKRGGIMADKKQLARLKKGVDAWNKWRKNKPSAKIDLSEADLSEANLRDADLSAADLSGADLSAADLSGADLRDADLRASNLSRAVLNNRALLYGTRLRWANLSEADLSYATIIKSDLSGADLNKSDLSHCRLGNAVIGDVDLSTTKGLEMVKHLHPSTIGINTIYKSKGNIPDVFLRGRGVPENFITFMHSLTDKAFDLYSCFISHSAKDKPFCERLYADLQVKDVRTWYFPEDAKWGETVWGEIDRGIKIYDKLVIVLSENSLRSKPVLREVQRSLDREDKEHKNILFPITLDRYVFDTWEHERKADVLEKVVGDFSGWEKDAAKYQKAFDKLLKGLQSDAIH